ncbi:alpha/beta hydrolase fold domain-containing protein [Heliobacillus mobilis]|uniref:Alpha/beta hydrolase fold domain-containing protein n=1 Tax=Heliobacterium mobile TaxID=28064 RepID=A0A6I3SJ84_HELMO|nr:alpha/beta hydrolase [Heliobacterium mobile]MTV48971.1 alpha/beta hydrolase fold domain-containing protein [Heliobacterium mobile]
MTLDPQVKEFLQHSSFTGTFPLSMLSPGMIRAASMMHIGPIDENDIGNLQKIENHTAIVDGREIPMRIYTPKGSAPHPVLVFFHGGGFVVGNLDSHDAFCREMAQITPCAVVSVDYRLAPEHKFPAALEDAYDAVTWVHDHAEEFHLDKERIAVGGDNAGGNLATVVAIQAKEKGFPKIVYQLLYYPSTNFLGGTESIREFGKGFLLTIELMEWFARHYLRDGEDRKNPYASPLLYPDHHGLPPAMIITAEYDPLRDDGEMYAKKLEEAGVPVTLRRYNGMIHGFASLLDHFDQAKKALEDGAKHLKNILYLG